MKWLCANGANVNARDWQGNTPLHCLASSKVSSTSVAKCLVEAGADLGAKNRDGKTALDLARSGSGSGAKEVAAYLEKAAKAKKTGN